MKRVFRTVRLILLVCLLGQHSPSASAADETNREIARTYGAFYLRQGELQAATEFLMRHLQDDAEDSGAWNLLGLAHLSGKQSEKAARAFYNAAERAGKSHPARGYYLYNYADALNQQARTKEAQSALRIAAQYPDLRGRARVALENLKPGVPFSSRHRGARRDWEGALQIATGYDSNVLLYSESMMSIAPETNTSSPLLSLISQVRRAPISFAGRELSLRMLAGGTVYASPASRPYNSAQGSLGVNWGPALAGRGAFTQDFDIDTSSSFINLNGFRFHNFDQFFTWRVSHADGLGNSTQWMLPLGYQRFRTEAGDDPANDRTGFGVSPSLSHRRRIGEGAFGIGLRHERLFARGPNYYSNTWALPLDFEHRVLGTNVAVGLERSFVAYPRSDTRKRDRLWSASLRLSRKISSDLSGALDYSLRHRQSTSDVFQFEKHAVAVMANYAIF